jgi:hypothetical protein
MNDNLPSAVNRKQFHFLLNSFLSKHRLKEKWFNASKSFKRKNNFRKEIYDKYGISNDEGYDELLYKCIDIYIGEAILKKNMYYDGTIRGFFRFIPSGGCDGVNWSTFCSKYSDLWEHETYYMKYGEND